MTIAPVQKTILVPTDPASAFKVFTAGLGSWWPKSHSINEVEAVDFVIEPKAGGRWYEVGVDGSQCETGRVLEYDPPHRLLLAWHLDGNWAYDPDPDTSSEIEVRFSAEGDGTRVDLEHRGLERHRTGGDELRSSVDSEGGWGSLLELYAGSL
jgi:uncharacterized protein YndB with AHSA1/START domain